MIEVARLTHRDVTDALNAMQREGESVQKSQATRLISELILVECGHPAPVPTDGDLSARLTACVACFAYYSYTQYATRNRKVVGEVVRRHTLGHL